MEQLNGKKLLVLGGTAYMIDIVQQAKSMGLYTIVTDWNDLDKAPAKRFADEYWNISLLDYEQLTAKVRENGIDGLVTGYVDSMLLPYQHLCELTGLPCYATKEVFEITNDKEKFKQFCREHDVSVIPEYDLSSFNPNVISEKNKVIVKPVDNSGSRGVILCKTPDDFNRCFSSSVLITE